MLAAGCAWTRLTGESPPAVTMTGVPLGAVLCCAVLLHPSAQHCEQKLRDRPIHPYSAETSSACCMLAGGRANGRKAKWWRRLARWSSSMWPTQQSCKSRHQRRLWELTPRRPQHHCCRRFHLRQYRQPSPRHHFRRLQRTKMLTGHLVGVEEEEEEGQGEVVICKPHLREEASDVAYAVRLVGWLVLWSTYTHANKHTYVHTYIRTYLLTHYVRTYIHACVHTNIHKY